MTIPDSLRRMQSSSGMWPHCGKSLATCVLAWAAIWPAWSAESTDSANAPAATSVRENPFLFSPPTTLRYDEEYPVIGYSGAATENPVARLQARLDRGEVKLTFNSTRGYLDSLLDALGLDRSSQTLVYSKTSFQVSMIRASTPRALYFNDDTYVAWTQGGELLEVGTMDTRLGPVFYALPNRAEAAARFDRPLIACISCHDSLTMTGGGVPRFILGSGYVGINGEQLTHEGRILTTDRTPLWSRWGGWYVTGTHGDQVHLGNIQVRNVNDLANLESVRRGNVENLDTLFDTRPYLTNKSDIVALLVLQHQVNVQNLITRVNFEVRTALARAGRTGPAADTAMIEFPPAVRVELQEFLDNLVNGMLFVDAAGFTSRIHGNSGFDTWFEARGPRDRKGRSLRKLDLNTRLFAYPLSYLIYSQAFDSLPAYARNYLYERFADVLTGADSTPGFAQLSAADRKAVLEILSATKPDFSKFMAARRSPKTP